MLDLTRLRVLAAVAAHGSVTAAAKALHYSQPSVSHHLSRLESETGARLIQRAGRGIRLTPEGELLARRATEIIGRVDAADAELAAFTGLRAGQVRVAAFQSALSVLVPPAAAALRRAHPGLDLQLMEAHPTVAAQQLRDGDADLAIVHGYSDAPPIDGMRYVHLLDDPMYLLSPHQGSSGRPPTLAGHVDSPWITGCEDCRVEFLRICAAAGFTPHIAYTSDDIIVDQALVAAGLGVTTMPGLALRSYLAAGIETAPLPGVRRRVYAATYGDPPDPPATRAFLQALQTATAAVVADLDLGALSGTAG